jgi:flagellar motor switch protein FliN/FliY
MPPVRGKVESSVTFADGVGVPGEPTVSPFGRVWDVPIELTVEVARTTAPLRETLNLRPGAIVPLNRLASEPVDLRAGGRLLAVGEVIVIDDEFGIRITDLARAEAHEDVPLDVLEPAGAATASALEELSVWQAAQQPAVDA